MTELQMENRKTRIFDEAARYVAQFIVDAPQELLSEDETIADVRRDGAATVLAAMDPWGMLESAVYALKRKDPALATLLQDTLNSYHYDLSGDDGNEAPLPVLPASQAMAMSMS